MNTSTVDNVLFIHLKISSAVRELNLGGRKPGRLRSTFIKYSV